MKKIVYLFSGQGSQYVGMGKDLFNRYKIMDETFKEASDILKFDLKKMCLEGNNEDLLQTQNSQPVLLTFGVGAFRCIMEEYEQVPFCLAGHSLGEITALTCSEAVSFEDAIKIVRKRGELMQDAGKRSGKMIALLDTNKEYIEGLCQKVQQENIESILGISNYNSVSQFVLSGNEASIEKAEKILDHDGIRFIPLKVSGAFHSPLMKDAANSFYDYLQNVNFSALKYPVLSNVTAELYGESTLIRDTLARQITMPVLWDKIMEYFIKENVDCAIEFGPGHTLKNLMQKNVPQINAFAYEEKKDYDAYQEYEAQSRRSMIEKCIAGVVCSRNTNWNNEELQKGVIEPYKKIEKMLQEIILQNRCPKVFEVKQAYNMLYTALNVKGVHESEIKEIMSDIGI